MDIPNLFVLPDNSQTGKSVLATQFVLRSCNRDIRTLTGHHAAPMSPPEFDCNKVPGKIAPLVSFENTYGHWVDGQTRVFKPYHCNDLREFASLLTSYVSTSIAKNRLWDLDNTIMVKLDKLISNPTPYPKKFVEVAKSQAVAPYNPFCAHPVQAYVESESKRGKDRSIFMIPSQSTVVTGIHGSLHNNTSLEMGFEEKEGTKDAQKRTYDTGNIGFVCAGHTAHSSDAGKSRRVCSYTRIRVLSTSIFDGFNSINQESEAAHDWTLYCMGITCNISQDMVWDIVYLLEDKSRRYFINQFIDFHDTTMMCPATYMVYEDDKILYLSISSGVLLRSIPGDTMIDSTMLYKQKTNSIVEHTCLPLYGPESIKYKYSAFFMMVPFVEHDRPPRTLFASGQTTQGIFLPWSPATARVSPLHASRPIVATEFVRTIEKDNAANPDAIWDVFAGEDLVVCYMNMALNFDDSMVLSSGFADRGGFATMSLCTYRISESENIPEVGERMCGKKYRWWKVDCTSVCTCKGNRTRSAISTSGRIPSGKVHQVIRTEDGHISIKILSFSQILTGDKISSMHGQKGIVRIRPQHELPVIVMKDGQTLIADLYIAVGSITSRQTSAQIYESAHGLRGVRTGVYQTLDGIEDTSSEECSYIMNPVTGKPIYRQLLSGTIEPIRATVGITRIINQTQMTRERHHLTHRPEGKHSTGTHPGRADGGGVSAAEMDFHAMYSSGLRACAQELFNRGNACLVPVCRNCLAIQPLHDCGIEGNMAMTIMSFDSAVFDQISAAVNGTCNRYRIEHS